MQLRVHFIVWCDLLLPTGSDTISLIVPYHAFPCFCLLDQAGKAFCIEIGSQCFLEMDPALRLCDFGAFVHLCLLFPLFQAEKANFQVS